MEGSDQDQRGLHLLTACLLALQGKKYNIQIYLEHVYIYLEHEKNWKIKYMNNVSGTSPPIYSEELVGTPHGPSGG